MKLSFLACIATWILPCSTLVAGPLGKGAVAPALKLRDQSGAVVNLADSYGSGPVLVYFYPKAETPGCTTQACNLRDAFTELQAAGIRVYGVSLDGVADLARFHARHALNFPLLSDEKGELARAFGVPVTAGFASRQSFLIHSGVVQWTDLKATPSTQAADVLAAWKAVREPRP